MAALEDFQMDKIRHDILLIIATALFIFFATGILGPEQTPVEPIIIPPA